MNGACSAERPLCGPGVFVACLAHVSASQLEDGSRSRLKLLASLPHGAHRAGPRQQVVASLGKLDERELAALRGGWDDLPALLRGEAPAPRPRTPPLPGLVSVGSDDSAPQ
jgi:hypothetical protein